MKEKLLPAILKSFLQPAYQKKCFFKYIGYSQT